MQAQTSPRQANNVFAWVIAVLGVGLMVLLFLSFMADARRPVTSEVAGGSTARVAYLQFGLHADTLWLADPSAPDERTQLITIPHAPEYGIVPSISPDGRRFAYSSLPEGTARPKPDSPAELWLAELAPGTAPRLLSRDIDLLVAPVWAPDGNSLVYRRSTDAAHVLVMTGIDGEERTVASSETEALFPVGFTADGSDLYFVGLSEQQGTHLRKVSMSTGVEQEVAAISPSMTRDWALSPDGSRLAYLEIAFSGADIASRASVLDIASGTTAALTRAGEVALGPVWSEGGSLATGVFNPGTGEASLLTVDGAARSRIDGPVSGFDVPVAYDAGTGSYLVRSFENDSVIDPGRSTLVLLSPNGERKTIAEGEVTLVGPTN